MIERKTVEPAVELPPPSAELVLIRVAIEAYLASAHEKPRRRARAFLDVMTAILATEESVALLFPRRPASERAAVAKARREAVAAYRQLLLPTFLSRVPLEPADDI